MRMADQKSNHFQNSHVGQLSDANNLCLYVLYEDLHVGIESEYSKQLHQVGLTDNQPVGITSEKCTIPHQLPTHKHCLSV